MASMTNKIALVVGGASGIGLATAQRLAAEGATVVLTGRKAADVAEAVATVGVKAYGIVADATDAAQIVQVVAEIVEAHGRIDALVLNAGMSTPAPIEEETEDHVKTLFAVNVQSAVMAMTAAMPALVPGSAVVLIGSIAGSAGVPHYGTYAATKAAIRSYARTWTAELAPRGIRVNVVSPGPTDTAMMAATSDEVRAVLVAQIPLGRMAKPAEIAAAATFLLSDDAGFIAGAELAVDGGMTQV